jgi:hypothetical protein
MFLRLMLAASLLLGATLATNCRCIDHAAFPPTPIPSTEADCQKDPYASCGACTTDERCGWCQLPDGTGSCHLAGTPKATAAGPAACSAIWVRRPTECTSQTYAPPDAAAAFPTH